MTTVNNTLSNVLINEHQVAELTGLSVATVRRWRLTDQGPKYLKLNSSVRYRPQDVEAWLATLPTGGSITEAA